jgi:hypothetical protein
MSDATIQIRDPIHTFISLNSEQAKIVDSPLFQRLRHIKQLALASLVYPGALHTRFEHSLGVFHVACEMLRRLGLEGDDINVRAVRFAALLHDLGHGPFSHVSEQSLNMFADRDSLPAEQKNEKIHELITAKLIRENPVIIRAIGEDTAETVVKLLNDWEGDPVMQAIISGPLDADKLDYLLRDSYFCGVAYGRFDSAQLLRSFRRVDRQLVLERSGMTAFEQYALAKYYITQNVYRHKGRLITDEMITRAIALGIRVDKISAMEKLYRFNNSAAFYKNYSQWQDARFLTEFSGKKAREGKCKQILDRLMARRLFKRVFSVDLDQFPTEIKAELSRYTETPENLEMRIRIERGVADVLSSELSTGRVDPDLVIFKCVRSKPICDLALNDGVVLVDDKVRLTPIEECSRFLRAVSKNGAGGGVDVEVYAPVEWENHTKRDAICDRLSARIMEAIKTGAKGGVSHDSI